MSSIPEDHSDIDTIVRSTVTRREFLAEATAATVSLMVLPALARAATSASFDFYISPTGSDANPGTAAQPWSPASLGLAASSSTSGVQTQSSQVVANQAQMAGKRIGLLPGNYVPSTFVTGIPGGYGTYFQFKASGPSATQPTILQSTTPLGAVFSMSPGVTGTSFVQTSGTGDLLWLSCNNVVVDGISFNYSNTGAFIRLTDTGAGTGNNITIQNCEFKNLDVSTLYGGSHDNVAAIEMHEVGDAEGSGLTVRNCYFNTVLNGGHVLDSLSFNANCIGGFQYTNITIDHCEFANAFSAFYPKGKCGYYKFTNNFVHDCLAMMRDANEVWPQYNSPVNANAPRNVIANNVAYNVGGIASGSGGNPAQCNVDVYNNTICFSGANGFRQYQIYSATTDSAYGSAVRPTTSKFYNNIMFNLGTANVPTYWFVTTGLPYNQVFAEMKYNCHDTHGFTFSDSYSGTTKTTLASWQSFSGYDLQSFQALPKFSGTPSSADPTQVKLAAGSPCLGTGRTTGTASGSACDMGAWGGANPPTQIGCNLKQGLAVPMAPSLIVS